MHVAWALHFKSLHNVGGWGQNIPVPSRRHLWMVPCGNPERRQTARCSPCSICPPNASCARLTHWSQLRRCPLIWQWILDSSLQSGHTFAPSLLHGRYIQSYTSFGCLLMGTSVHKLHVIPPDMMDGPDPRRCPKIGHKKFPPSLCLPVLSGQVGLLLN